MNVKWKYVEKLDENQLTKIENYFNIKLPNDYKEALTKCNRGKPQQCNFNTENRKDCVLDYMINLEETIQISKRVKNNKLISIATDPFGNLIGYQIDNNEISSIIFWDHETKKSTFIADNFKAFLNKLY